MKCPYFKALRVGGFPEKGAATPGDGLLIAADGMLPSSPGLPQQGTGVIVTAAEWAAAREKRLSIYLEFPRSLPTAAGAAPAVLPVLQTGFVRENCLLNGL